MPRLIPRHNAPAQKDLAPISLGLAAWPSLRALRMGSVALALVGLLALATFRPPLTLETVALIIAYSALFAVGSVALQRIEDGVWTGYPYIIGLVLLLTVGVSTALLVVIAGAGLAALVQARPTPLPGLPRLTPIQATSLALARIAITGGATAAAGLVWALLAPTTPTSFLIARLLAVLLAIVVAFLTACAIDSLIRGRLSDAPTRLRWLWEIGRTPLEVLSALVVVVAALIAPLIPTSLQVVLMALVVLQAIRYKSVSQMQDELCQRVAQLSQINRAGEAMASTLTLDALVETICRQAQQITQTPLIRLALVESDEGTVESYSFAADGGLTRERSLLDADPLVGAVMRQNIPIHPDDLRTRPVTPRPPFQPVLGLPLRAGAQAIGALMLYAQPPADRLDAATVDALQALARQAGLALNNAALYNRSQELVSNLSLINLSVRDMMKHLDRSEAIEKAAAAALTVGKADAVLFVLSQPGSSKLELVTSAGLEPARRSAYGDLFHFNNFQLPDTPASLLDANSPDLREIANLGGFGDLRSLPLATGRDLHGWLLLGYAEHRLPRASEQELLWVLTQHISASIDNSELINALETYAYEMAQLAHLSRTSMVNLDLERVVTDVGEILNQMMMVNRTTVALFESDNGPLRIVGTVIGLERQPVTAADEKQARFPELFEQLKRPSPSYRAYHADEAVSTTLRQLLVANDEWSLAVAPMTANERLIGVILLGSQEKRVFTEREWQLAEMAANQIATQLQNAQLYTVTTQALKQRLEQLALIEDLARQISSTLDFNQIVKHMLEAAIRSTQAQYAALILLMEPGSTRMIVIDYTNGKFSRYFMNFGLDDSIIGQTIRTGTTKLTPDTRSNPYYVAPRTGTTYRASLAVPLIQETNVLGVLNVESESTGGFTEAHVGFLSNLAGHAVISIGNARMMEERQYQVKVLTSLQSLALQLSSTVDTLSVAKTIVDTAQALFEADEATVYRYNPAAETLTPLTSRGVALLAGEAEGLAPANVAREAAQTNEIQLVQVGPSDETYASTVSIPLPGTGRVRDVLSVTFATQRHFPKRDYDTLALLGSQAAGHLENATLHEEIRAGNERMAAILNSTRDGVILIDRQAVLVEANPAARTLFGDGLTAYLADVVTGPVWQPDDESATGVRLHVQTNGTDSRLVVRRQFEYRGAQGGITYLEEIGSPVVDEHGAAGWLLVLRDVTEEKLLADYRDEITSMVVHDLRGPMASIISGLYLALDELSQREDLKTVSTILSVSSESANSLMGLVETLLDVSRMEARQMVLRIDTIHAARLVDRAEAALASTLQQAAVTLERDLPADLPPLQGDYDLLARVLINLLDNAVRHTPPGTRVLIGAEVVDDGAALLLRVADSGRGIAPDERERVFEKFKQAKASAGRGMRGSGLGLTFCRLAVEAHGGRIWIEEQGPLPGASFVFTIPLAANSEATGQ